METLSKTEIDTSLWGIALVDLTMYFWEDYRGTLELWSRKAIDFSKLSKLLYEILEDKSVVRNANNQCLTCDVSEESFIVT